MLLTSQNGLMRCRWHGRMPCRPIVQRPPGGSWAVGRGRHHHRRFAATNSVAHVAPHVEAEEVPQPTAATKWAASRTRVKPIAHRSIPAPDQPPPPAAATPVESVPAQPAAASMPSAAGRPSWVSMHVQVLTYLAATGAMVGAAGLAALGIRWYLTTRPGQQATDSAVTRAALPVAAADAAQRTAATDAPAPPSKPAAASIPQLATASAISPLPQPVSGFEQLPSGWWRGLDTVYYLNFGSQLGMMPRLPLSVTKALGGAGEPGEHLLVFESQADADFVAGTITKHLELAALATEAQQVAAATADGPTTTSSSSKGRPASPFKGVKGRVVPARPGFVESCAEAQGVLLEVLPRNRLQHKAELGPEQLQALLQVLVRGPSAAEQRQEEAALAAGQQLAAAAAEGGVSRHPDDTAAALGRGAGSSLVSSEVGSAPTIPSTSSSSSAGDSATQQPQPEGFVPVSTELPAWSSQGVLQVPEFGRLGIPGLSEMLSTTPAAADTASSPAAQPPLELSSLSSGTDAVSSGVAGGPNASSLAVTRSMQQQHQQGEPAAAAAPDQVQQLQQQLEQLQQQLAAAQQQLKQQQAEVPAGTLMAGATAPAADAGVSSSTGLAPEQQVAADTQLQATAAGTSAAGPEAAASEGVPAPATAAAAVQHAVAPAAETLMTSSPASLEGVQVAETTSSSTGSHSSSLSSAVEEAAGTTSSSSSSSSDRVNASSNGTGNDASTDRSSSSSSGADSSNPASSPVRSAVPVYLPQAQEEDAGLEDYLSEWRALQGADQEDPPTTSSSTASLFSRKAPGPSATAAAAGGGASSAGSSNGSLGTRQLQQQQQPLGSGLPADDISDEFLADFVAAKFFKQATPTLGSNGSSGANSTSTSSNGSSVANSSSSSSSTPAGQGAVGDPAVQQLSVAEQSANRLAADLQQLEADFERLLSSGRASTRGSNGSSKWTGAGPSPMSQQNAPAGAARQEGAVEVVEAYAISTPGNSNNSSNTNTNTSSTGGVGVDDPAVRGLQQQLLQMQREALGIDVGALQRLGLVRDDGRVDREAGLQVAAKLEGLLAGLRSLQASVERTAAAAGVQLEQPQGPSLVERVAAALDAQSDRIEAAEPAASSVIVDVAAEQSRSSAAVNAGSVIQQQQQHTVASPDSSSVTTTISSSSSSSAGRRGSNSRRTGGLGASLGASLGQSPPAAASAAAVSSPPAGDPQPQPASSTTPSSSSSSSSSEGGRRTSSSSTQRSWGAWGSNPRIKKAAVSLLNRQPSPSTTGPSNSDRAATGSSSSIPGAQPTGSSSSTPGAQPTGSSSSTPGAQPPTATSTPAAAAASARQQDSKPAAAAAGGRDADGSTIISKKVGSNRFNTVQRAPEERVNTLKEALRVAVKRAEGQVDQDPGDADLADFVVWDKEEGPPQGWQQQQQRTGGGGRWSGPGKRLRWSTGGQMPWWRKRFQVLFIPNISLVPGAGAGFLQVNVSLDAAVKDLRIIAFEDRHDCLHCCAVMAQWPNLQGASISTGAMPTSAIESEICESWEELARQSPAAVPDPPKGLVVFRRGKLPLRVGMEEGEFMQTVVYQAAAQVTLSSVGYEFDDF